MDKSSLPDWCGSLSREIGDWLFSLSTPGQPGQDNVYGTPISEGKAESDLHGTVLFSWAHKMIANLLNVSNEWQMPIN